MIYPAPCREKYVDETVGVWMVWGKYEDGNVDVSDQDKTIARRVPLELAEKLVALQAEFREKIYALVCQA